jgi:hypothetical protein
MVAAVLGFAWMGEGGAVVFALVGLWGSQGVARPWRLGRHAVGLLTVAATLFPCILWLIGAVRPDFAQAVLDVFPHAFERVLGLTMADGRAQLALAQAGRLDHMAVIRLGVGACWLCTLPAAAAIVLWSDVRPSARRWARDGACFDPMVLLFGGVCGLVAMSLIVLSGFGFGPGRRSLAFGLGALLYPAAFWVWLVAIATLRAWVNWWFRPVAEPPAEMP